MLETPRDVKRLVGMFHVLAGMVGQEVDWIDLLGYCALQTKFSNTVARIRREPEDFVEDAISVRALARQSERRSGSLRNILEEVLNGTERGEGASDLLKFLFPSLLGKLGRETAHADALRLRRPLLTTLRLGLLPGAYSRADIISLAAKTPEEIEQFLRNAHKNDGLAPFIDRLDDLYRDLKDINHVQFWKGIGKFVRKPDCEWMSTFQPMHDIIQNFAGILLRAVSHDKLFREIAGVVFTNLRNVDETVLTVSWLRTHIFMYGLFGSEKRQEDGAFLAAEQTEAVARDPIW